MPVLAQLISWPHLLTAIGFVVLALACCRWRKAIARFHLQLVQSENAKRFWTEDRAVDFFTFVSFGFVIFAIVRFSNAFSK